MGWTCFDLLLPDFYKLNAAALLTGAAAFLGLKDEYILRGWDKLPYAGEPLFRDDFLEIIDALIERDIRIAQIYSNGVLITKKFLTELDKRNIHPEFYMSYDGVDGWHNWLRGVKG